MSERQASSFVALTAVCAVVLFSVLLFAVRDESIKQEVQEATVAIAVEHASPATLTVSMSVGKEEGIIEFTADGDAPVSLELPSSWHQREVRGGPLDAVIERPANGERTVWQLPPAVTASFWLQGAPVLRIRNASPSPLLILSKRVNVVTGTIEESSALID